MTFPLKIVTLDRGICFEGVAEKLIVRTVGGDVAILARHMNYVAPLGMGQAVVEMPGERRYGACIGGAVMVICGNVTLVPTTFEWADQINVSRVQRAEEEARKMLKGQPSEMERRLAQARLQRALVRKSVATHRK